LTLVRIKSKVRFSSTFLISLLSHENNSHLLHVKPQITKKQLSSGDPGWFLTETQSVNTGKKDVKKDLTKQSQTKTSSNKGNNKSSGQKTRTQ